MAEFNKFNLYSMGFEAATIKKVDEIDKHIDFLKFQDDYDEVRSYLVEHFGNIENDKWFEYPELGKSLYLVISDEKLEFCAQKNHKDYYGKGWRKIKEE